MLTMNFRYKIYPSLEQETRMVSWWETLRGVYNSALCDRQDWLNSRKCPIDRCRLKQCFTIPADASYPDDDKQQNASIAAKTEFPHLKDVQSQVLQEQIRRIEGALAARKHRGHGFPRFKKFGQSRWSWFPQFKSNPVQGDEIKLPTMGTMLIGLHHPIPEGFVIKTVRVIRKYSGGYATVGCQVDVKIPELPPQAGHAMGIDVGMEYFLSPSEGLPVERLRFLGKLPRKLEWRQRRLNGKPKGCGNRDQLTKKIGRVDEKIVDCRLDWQFKLTHQLGDRRSRNIWVEDLDFRGIAKGFLGKHTLDAALGQFLHQVLPWIGVLRGVDQGKVYANGTSQFCLDCGAGVKQDLSVRIHEGHECGSVKPTDVASRQAIEARGLSGREIACGWELSGAMATLPRLDGVQEVSRAT